MSAMRAISTSRRELSSRFFSPLQGKAPEEIHAILTETLACFLPGRAKDLPTPLLLSPILLTLTANKHYFRYSSANCMSVTTAHLAVQIGRLREVQSKLGTYFEHGTVELPIEVSKTLHIFYIYIYIGRLKKICPTSFRETCQWLKFPLKELGSQSRVSPTVGLLHLASGPACLGMAFPPLEYKRNWIQHVNRMPRDRLPRIMKHYSPNGRRNRGRPLKRLLDT